MHVHPTALLLCRSGELAGSKIELSGDTTLGRDAGNRVVAASDAGGMTERYARFFLSDGHHFVELLSMSEAATIDGAVVSGIVALDRRHVIAVGGLEFVYSRSSVAATPLFSERISPLNPIPTVPPAPPAPPGPVQTPGPADRTMLDGAGFLPLPPLHRATPLGGPSVPATPARPDVPPPIKTEPRAKQRSSPAPETMMEAVGWAALPALAKRSSPEAAVPPSTPPTPASVEPAEPAEPAVPAEPGVPPKRVQVAEPATDIFVAPVQSPHLELRATLPDVGPMLFTLKFGENLIGRGIDCDIVIPDAKNWLSRKHAIIRVSQTAVELVDLNGVNGTFVDGRQITTALLTPGSRFSLGPHLEFALQKT